MGQIAKRTKEQNEQLMKDIIYVMRRSIDAYDDGFVGEGQRLAIAMLPIIRDTEAMPSILTELGLRECYFYDVSPDYNPSIGLPFSGLATPTIGKHEAKYRPRLNTNPNLIPKKLSFDAWRNKEVVIDEGKDLHITREKLVTAVANTFSGEINVQINKAFNELILANCMGWVDATVQPNIELLPLAYPSVRHIAFELLQSLHEQAPDYFK